MTTINIINSLSLELVVFNFKPRYLIHSEVFGKQNCVDSSVHFCLVLRWDGPFCFYFEGYDRMSCWLSACLSGTGGRLRTAGCGGCRPRCGDELRAGCLCPGGCPSPRRPAPAALGTHEASADEAASCQSEAESGRRPRACTGASGSPGRGRVWLISARTRASPPACWAPMSGSRFPGTSSRTRCRTPAGSCPRWAPTRGGGKRCIWPEGLCSLLLLICCTNCWPSGTNNELRSSSLPAARPLTGPERNRSRVLLRPHHQLCCGFSGLCCCQGGRGWDRGYGEGGIVSGWLLV